MDVAVPQTDHADETKSFSVVRRTVTATHENDVDDGKTEYDHDLIVIGGGSGGTVVDPGRAVAWLCVCADLHRRLQGSPPQSVQ